MNKCYLEEINKIIAGFDMSVFDNKSILITGATGLIGRMVALTLLQYNRQNNSNVKLVLCVRNIKKAEELFGKENEYVKYIVSNIEEIKFDDEHVDYIIHAASLTASKDFINKPVEVMNTAIRGTSNVLEYAKKEQVKGFVYLSSMEVYGTPKGEDKIKEEYSANIDIMDIRNCYPESKRVCESMCIAYAREYGVHTRIARLTQTFGPGVSFDDGRVFADFARHVLNNTDIILFTDGQTKRCYLYVCDAVKAIFLLLTQGKDGEAYNVANENTYCSIKEMANMVAERCANKEIKVIQNISDDSKKLGFAMPHFMNLDTSKISKIGFNPTSGLEEMFNKMIEDMREGL